MSPATPSEFDDLVAEAIAAGKKSGRGPWVRSIYGLRAWLHGDNSTAIRLIDESLRNVQDEWHIGPWWGVGHCCASLPTPALKRRSARPH
jgi:hypothetical protein